jgi:hypothetical protein
MQTATVAKYPDCSFCGEEAHFDGKTVNGWAFMCDCCFVVYGQGLGLGVGQQLVTAALDATGENVPFAGEYAGA